MANTSAGSAEVTSGTTDAATGQGGSRGTTLPTTTSPTSGPLDSSGGFVFDVGTVADTPGAGCECGQASEFS